MIAEFKGRYRFLSNFYPAWVSFDGDLYPTVEHAYQAAKTLDPSIRKHVRVADSPGEAKRRGRKAPLRAGWEDAKLGVMLDLLRQKFARTAGTVPFLEAWAKLLATEDQELIEGNTWGDTFWGVCKGEGENHLGRLLMQVRGEL